MYELNDSTNDCGVYIVDSSSFTRVDHIHNTIFNLEPLHASFCKILLKIVMKYDIPFIYSGRLFEYSYLAGLVREAIQLRK